MDCDVLRDDRRERIKSFVPGGTRAGVACEADLEWLMMDPTIVRAHQHVAGAQKLKGGRMPRAWVGLAEA